MEPGLAAVRLSMMLAPFAAATEPRRAYCPNCRGKGRRNGACQRCRGKGHTTVGRTKR